MLMLPACTILGPSLLLDRADRLIGRGDYGAAVRAYDEFLAKYPDLAGRVQARRDTVANLVAAQADLTRLRGELTARESELSRLKQEVERLRTDIEELKRIDLRQEERRRR
jgi:predicted nuclease with TOPRIM domain